MRIGKCANALHFINGAVHQFFQNSGSIGDIPGNSKTFEECAKINLQFDITASYMPNQKAYNYPWPYPVGAFDGSGSTVHPSGVNSIFPAM
ncbi:MAG: hypothetical protein M1282_07045 [Chloroflexi bacterium]|nr:hypothetical protein [Chloroflexota bacterium]